MILKADTAYNIGFTINYTTGAAADADSLPTASVYSNTTEIVASGSVTVAKITSEDGVYTASFTTPESVTLGQTVKLLIKATVDSVACKSFKNLGLFGKTVDELNDIDGSSVTVTTNSDKTGYSLATAPPTSTEIKNAIEAGDLAAIKAKTDGLNFTGTDVKATLDNEQVTTDEASRNASKATGFAVAGDAMTLTAAYDAAKTAAQTSDVSEVKDAVDTLSGRLYGD